MRDDLLEAKAAIDWPVSKFPSLKNRMDAWLRDNVSVMLKDPDPKIPNYVIVAVEKEFLPLSFNVEVGAYLNTIRTSLDILATALAHRYHMARPDKMYFPIVEDAEIFARGQYKGHEFVEGLPAAERAVIESLKPYKGGNNLLWDLHNLDIVRKHRRLLTVDPHPERLSLTGWHVDHFFSPVAAQGWVRGNGETILGIYAKDAPQPKIEYSPYIGFGETAVLTESNVLRALDNFASAADAIIALFDTP